MTPTLFELYPPTLVESVYRMSAGWHCFFKQICSPEGTSARTRIQALAAQAGSAYAARATELLTSFDNRKFFQGFSEIATLAHLQAGGMSLSTLHWPGPFFQLQRPGGPPFLLSVLAFLQPGHPAEQRQMRQRLRDALNRTTVRQRFTVAVRVPPPPTLDPEPIRRAVEVWQAQVAAGQWEGTQANYTDDQVALDFCLTPDLAEGRPPVVEVFGPDRDSHAFELVQDRILQETNFHQSTAHRKQPLLLACVLDARWPMTDNGIRAFLYGQPRQIRVEDGRMEVTYYAEDALFAHPAYASLSGVIFLDRPAAAGVEMRARAFLNPWAQVPLLPEQMGMRCFAEAAGPSRSLQGSRVLSWENKSA